ncbi:hypothetical protein Tco_1224579 [Tanacetum coccineum]
MFRPKCQESAITVHVGKLLEKSSGIIANSFVGFEERVVSALRNGSKHFSLDAVLPEGFLTRSTDKGLVVKAGHHNQRYLTLTRWVDLCVIVDGTRQLKQWLLGCLPMVAWPLYAEQKMNRVYLVEEIKVALRLKMSTGDEIDGR